MKWKRERERGMGKGFCSEKLFSIEKKRHFPSQGVTSERGKSGCKQMHCKYNWDENLNESNSVARTNYWVLYCIRINTAETTIDSRKKTVDGIGRMTTELIVLQLIDIIVPIICHRRQGWGWRGWPTGTKTWHSESIDTFRALYMYSTVRERRQKGDRMGGPSCHLHAQHWQINHQHLSCGGGGCSDI